MNPLGFTPCLTLERPNLTADPSRTLFRAKKLFPELVYDTAALEDSPYTFPEVQTLLEGITVGGHRLTDQKLVLNQAESWKALIRLVERGEFREDKATVLALHRLVAEEEALEWGAFRTGAVSIAGTTHQPPASTELERLFADGLDYLIQMRDPLLRGIHFFLFGALNQFFWDGNKRTSRLMMNGILMSAGIDAISIPARDKLAFNQAMIRFYDGKDAAEMVAFMLARLPAGLAR